MSAAGWVALALAGWFVVAFPLGALAGRWLYITSQLYPEPRPGTPAPDRPDGRIPVDFSDLSDLDATDLLDKAEVFTSNIASVLHGLIDAGAEGTALMLENLRPLAEQADGFLGDANDPVPAPPAGGVPVDAPVADSPADAAATVGVVAQ